MAATRVIVNCGIGDHYARLSCKVSEFCTRYSPEAKQVFWDRYPPTCPEHVRQNYAFKIHALQSAIEKFGTDAIYLWIDSTFIPVSSMEPLWAFIEKHGWYAPMQGSSVLGTWTTDDFLCIANLSRDAAMEIPLCYSGLVGLDLSCELGRGIWREWVRSYQLGMFNGPHLNTPNEKVSAMGNKFQGHCSRDERVEGHRHDESALSLILHRHGLTPVVNQFLMMYSPENGFIDRTYGYIDESPLPIQIRHETDTERWYRENMEHNAERLLSG